MYRYLGLGDSSDSVTFVIISITITTVTVIAKNYFTTVDMWLQTCAFDIVLPQHTHNHMKNTVRKISDGIDIDNKLEVFLLEL